MFTGSEENYYAYEPVHMKHFSLLQRIKNYHILTYV